LGIIKEGLSDYNRHKIDRQTNTTPANRLTKSESGQCSYQQIYQKDVKVGDILELEHEAVVPADCVVLRVVSGSSAGAAYI
jgi:magnesium-transporting ATPase (P-type)